MKQLYKLYQEKIVNNTSVETTFELRYGEIPRNRSEVIENYADFEKSADFETRYKFGKTILTREKVFRCNAIKVKERDFELFVKSFWAEPVDSKIPAEKLGALLPVDEFIDYTKSERI